MHNTFSSPPSAPLTFPTKLATTNTQIHSLHLPNENIKLFSHLLLLGYSTFRGEENF
jgi:hypothetical protein